MVVPTHCRYPSNGVVQVEVEGGGDSFRVHDNGRAFDEFQSSGLVPGCIRSGNSLHCSAGLMVTTEPGDTA